MGELVIQYHDFENAKKEIKKFSEQTTTDLDLRRVDDSKGAFNEFQMPVIADKTVEEVMAEVNAGKKRVKIYMEEHL